MQSVDRFRRATRLTLATFVFAAIVMTAHAQSERPGPDRALAEKKFSAPIIAKPERGDPPLTLECGGTSLVCRASRWPGDGGDDGVREWFGQSDAEWQSDLRLIRGDLAGNTYLAGSGNVTGNLGASYTILRYTPDGQIDPTWAIWPFFTSGNGDNRTLVDLQIGADNLVYFVGTTDNGRMEVVRLNAAGRVTWIAERPGETPVALAVDDAGDAYVAALRGGSMFLQKYTTSSPEIVWEVAALATANSNFPVRINLDDRGTVFLSYTFVSAIIERFDLRGNRVGQPLLRTMTSYDSAVSRDGVFYHVGQSENGRAIVEQLTPQGGIGAWESQVPASFYRHAALQERPDGNLLAVAGETVAFGTGRDFMVATFQSFGSFPVNVWFDDKIYNGPVDGDDIPAGVAFDRLGNVYVTGSSPGADGTGLATVKYAVASDWGEIGCPEGGCLAWENDLIDGAWREEDLSSPPTVGLLVDGVGDVIFAGKGKNASSLGQPWVAYRLSQAFLSFPQQVINSSVTISATNESIWAPGDGLIEGGISVIPPDLRDNLDTPPATVTWNFNETVDGGFDIFGVDFGGGFQAASTNGEAQLGLEARASGGTVDVNYPFQFEMCMPSSPEELVFDPDFGLVLVFRCFVDPSAGFSIEPADVSAALQGIFRGNFLLRAFAEAFDDDIFDEIIFNETADFDGNILTTTDLLGGDLQQEFDIPVVNPLISGFVRLPRIAPKAQVPEGESDCAERVLVAEGSDSLLAFGSDQITNYITSSFGVPTAFELALPLPLDGSLSAGIAVLQFLANAVIYVDQRFEFTAREPVVRFRLEPVLDPNNPPPVWQEFPVTSPDPLAVPPGTGSSLTFYPSIEIPSDQPNFKNVTKLRLVPSVGFDPLRVEIGLEAGGFDLFSEDACVVCQEWDIIEEAVTIYETEFQLGDGAAFEEVFLPPFTLIGTAEQDAVPTVVAVSKSSLPAFFFDQLRVGNDETYLEVRTQFEEFVDGTVPLLLQGRFFRGSGRSTVYYCIHGREEPLNTIWIDGNNLRIDFPNHLRLIPGIGRFVVKTSQQGQDTVPTSNSLDFPITYPLPRIVAAGPNLWAADPDFEDLLITVADGLTPAGGDSFIKRSDYWIQLDRLWADAALPLTLADYFPYMNFNRLPPMPLILWSGDPLTTYGEPIDSGLLWAQLPREYFLEPRNVSIRVINPGPGGGTSGSVPLTVAAPRPMVQSLEPAVVPVGVEPFRMMVRGPEHVTAWQDPECTETPRRSNFNSSSVVRIDGNPVPTMFVSSSMLLADVPASVLNAGGRKIVTVFNPSGGTEYLYKQCDGDEEFPPQLIPSGGESVWIPLDVTNPIPELASVSPSFFIEDFVADYNPKTRPPSDLSVFGTGFTPQTTVLFNGRTVATEYVSERLLKAQLIADDVDEPGIAQVRVSTPGPGGGVSGQLAIEILPGGDNLPPTAIDLEPSFAFEDRATALEVFIQGSNFGPNTYARWLGDETPVVLTTTFIGAEWISVELPPELFVDPGTYQIEVVAPPPGGGVAMPLDFEVLPLP